MVSINKLRKRNTNTFELNNVDSIYNQYIEDYQIYFENSLNKTDFIDYYNEKVVGKCIVLDVSVNNQQNGDEKYLTTLPNSKLYIGQLLTLKFEDDLKFWLITEKEHLAIPSHDKFKIRPCNFILKWMDDTTGKLLEQPCIVLNNTKYTGGTKTSTVGITEVEAMVNITIQNNSYTRNITYGKRLFTMKNAWRVTLIDDITTANVFSFTLGKDSLTANDNVELGICDYYTHSYTISLPSNNEQIIVGGTFNILPKVTDKNVVVNNPNVTYKSSDETIATVDKNGKVTALKLGNCIISCEIDDTIVDLTINVISVPITNVTTYQLIPSNGTVLKLASSTSLTTSKYNNNVQIPCDVDYVLDANGQTLLNSKKISVLVKEGKDSNNIVWVKNNVSATNPNSFVITIKDKVDGTVIDNVTIQLKGV